VSAKKGGGSVSVLKRPIVFKKKNYAGHEANSFVLFAPLRLGVSFFFLKCIALLCHLERRVLAGVSKSAAGRLCGSAA
jgi:hypothetical protein